MNSMNDHALQNLLREWQRLAETEGDAIRNSDWKLLADCQKAIKQLQPRIEQIIGARPFQSAAASEPPPRHPLVANLIELERRNQELLAERRHSARLQLDQLDQTTQQLRRVRRSYAPSKNRPERLSLLS